MPKEVFVIIPKGGKGTAKTVARGFGGDQECHEVVGKISDRLGGTVTSREDVIEAADTERVDLE